MDRRHILNEPRRGGRPDRVASRFFAASLAALLACQGAERPLEARPPDPTPPPPHNEQAPHDDFHALLAKPASSLEDGEAPAEVLKAAVERSNAASFEVWRALQERENVVVSPYGIRSALGLVYLASAPGSGRSSLQSRLHYPARNEDMDIRLLHEAARAAEATGFGSASALWVDRQRVVSPAYLDAVSRTLAAEVHSIDLVADPGRAVRTIDAWASERTRGQVPSILERGSIQELTRSVLVDAASLSWDAPMNPGLIATPFPRPFTTSRGTTVKADMTFCSPCTAVIRNDYQAAIATYRGSESLAFVVVMPRRWSGFRWNAAAFRRVWASFAAARLAELELPELRLRSRVDLGAVMSKLDLDLVDTRLQEGLLASGEPVALGAFVHEASIQLKETTFVFEPSPNLSRKLLGERLSLRVDRPFYFALVEPKTGLVLLMGQVTDPTL